jgi:serine phosphatase RsbU (regulator of sigma subunit)
MSLHIASIALLAAAVALLVALVLLYRMFPVLLIYRSKAQLESAFDSFDDPLTVIDSRYTILRANRAYATLVARPFQEILGGACYAVLRGRTSPCDDCLMRETLRDQARNVIERSAHPARGDDAAISFTFFPFSGSATKPAVVEHIRDISELEKLRDRLARKNDQLEKTAADLQEAQSALFQEIDMAREVQECILPKTLATVEGLRLAVAYQPVETVGGDIYDAVRFSDTRLGVFIGDAAGHGLPAAFVSTMAKMSLYHHTRQEAEPHLVLERINRDVLDNIKTSHYLTCFWCIFDATAATLTFSRAGHPKPIVVRPGGEVVELDAPGTLLGILENVVYTQSTFQCRKGDRIYLFTDGVYMSAVREGVARPAFGNDHFRQALVACAATPFDDIIPALRQVLSAYQREDDYTLLVMEVTKDADQRSASAGPGNT